LGCSRLVTGVDDLASVGRPGRAGLCTAPAGDAASTSPKTEHIDLGVAILADGAGEASASGSETGAGVRARELDETDARSGGEINHVDVSITCLIAGVGELATIRAESR